MILDEIEEECVETRCPLKQKNDGWVSESLTQSCLDRLLPLSAVTVNCGLRSPLGALLQAYCPWHDHDTSIRRSSLGRFVLATTCRSWFATYAIDDTAPLIVVLVLLLYLYMFSSVL